MRYLKRQTRLKGLGFVLGTLALLVFPNASVANQAEEKPQLDPRSVISSAAAHSESTVKLEGKAEVNAIKESEQTAEWAKFYNLGVKALNSRNFASAASYFKSAGDAVESTTGSEKFLAESRFAEAQTRMLLGQAKIAARLYQAAVDLFQEYDPLNPYLKAALDGLRRTSPELKGKVAQAEFRLKAMTNPTKIVLVDRNVILKGRVTDSDNVRLLTEKGTADVNSEYVRKAVHQAFLKMTCLETAELGSNYNTADATWLPLLAHGRTVALSASSDFMAPAISVKLNGRFYNVAVDLPDLTNKKTVFLLTDGSRIIAIDPSNEDVWLMNAHFKGQSADFSWKKLNHRKYKR